MKSNGNSKKYGQSIFIDGLEEFINNNYVNRGSELLLEIEKFAIEKKFPILSPASGKILSNLVQITNPATILELGTGFGYSSLWMLSSVESDFKITTVDRDSTHSLIAKQYIQSYSKNKVTNMEFINSDCYEYIQKKIKYDLIFLDCDKLIYNKIFNFIINEKLCKYIIIDNMLWHGRIMNPSPSSTSDQSIIDLWKTIKENNLNYTLFPSGDGLLFIQL